MGGLNRVAIELNRKRISDRIIRNTSEE